ncbi:MAG: caspase family protein [candidate division WOR-3 bacterium]|nr:caspase family protein [candidate division WOR-3 bacterium]
MGTDVLFVASGGTVVVASVGIGSPYATAGFLVGDVVEYVGKRRVSDGRTLRDALAALPTTGRAVLFRVMRGKVVLYIAVESLRQPGSRGNVSVQDGRSPTQLESSLADDSLLLGLSMAATMADAIGVVVGATAYKQAPKAEYAAEDARAVREYLVRAFGYQEGNIIFLPDPTKGQLEEVFGSAGNPRGKLFNWVKPQESNVFVYYAGHGAPSVSDKKGYLVPVDASPDYVSASGYPLDLLYANLAKMPAKSITVVIDACFSGLAADTGGRSTMLLKDASPLVVAPVSEDVPSKLSVFAAATGSQLASWYPEKGHSLFTYWFLMGLKGDADTDHDGSITLGEMKAYLSENVTYTARRLYGRDQTPEVRGRMDAEILRTK